MGQSVSSLSIAEVSDHVRGLGGEGGRKAFAAYAESIVDKCIDGKLLVSLPEEDYADFFDLIEITNNMHRQAVTWHFYEMGEESDKLVIAIPPSSQLLSHPSSPFSTSSTSSIIWDQLSLADYSCAVLGKGAFGIILRATLEATPSSSPSSLQSEVAVKIMQPESGPDADRGYEQLKESFESEIRILKEIESKLSLESEHIIKILGVAEGDLPPSFQVELGMKKALGIVMRLEAGGTLAKFLRDGGGLRVVDKLHIAMQMARGLAELHEIGVIHGGINPDNILLSHHNPPLVRLGGFGQSTFSSSNNSSIGVSTLKSSFSKHGAPHYSAPELLAMDVNTGSQTKPSRKSDVYAMSLVYYELFCTVHQPPFHDIIGEQQLVEHVALMDRRPPISAISSDTPDSISRMIELAWHKDRSLRPSAMECYTRTDQCYHVMSPNNFDIFLSHSWTNKNVMIYMKRFFASIGYRTFYDQDDMQWNIKRSMEEGVLRSNIVLACINRDYESSHNCMLELSEACKLAGKPIVTLSTDSNPSSWSGTDKRFGDLKQLCDIGGQGKMFFDIGDICADPAWNETDDGLIPTHLIDSLNFKLSELVKFLQGSHIKCIPPLVPQNKVMDAICEKRIKADKDSWNKRRANVAALPIASAADAHVYLRAISNFDSSALGEDAVIVSQFASINALQKGNKAFNEELVRLGACELLAKILKLPSLSEYTVAKLFSLINFLCRYDGETKDTNMNSHLVRLAHCGVLELIVSTLSNYADNSPLVAEQACRAIRNIAFNADNNTKLSSAGCCELLTSVLSKYKDSSHAVCEKACGAIFNMSNNVENRAKFGSLGCCELLTSVLQQHKDNSVAICENVCGAISNMSCNNADNKTKFGSLNCCELLASVLQQHKDNSAAVCEKACGAISNMSCNNAANKAKLGSLNCCELLVSVLINHEDSSDAVYENVCGAISNMSCNNVDNRTKFGSASCCELLVKVLSKHQDGSAAVCEKACGAIWNMSDNNNNNKAKFGSLNACELLVNILTKHQDSSAAVCERACGAIWNMSANADNKTKFVSLGCCELLVTILTKHQDSSASVCERACGAIWNMSYNNADNKAKFGSLGCCEILINVLQKHKDNSPTVCEKVCGTIWNMSYNVDNRAKFGSLNCCEILVNVLQKHKDSNTQVCEQACLAIWSIANDNDDNRAKFGSAGACELLVDILTKYQDSSATVCERACGAIWGVASENKSNELKFASLNCVSILNSVLARHKDHAGVIKQVNIALGSFK